MKVGPYGGNSALIRGDMRELAVPPYGCWKKRS